MKAFICNECHRVISERDLFFWKNWNFSAFYCSAECYAKSHGGVRYQLGSKEHASIVKEYGIAIELARAYSKQEIEREKQYIRHCKSFGRYEENDEQADEETNDFCEFGRFAGLDLE